MASENTSGKGRKKTAEELLLPGREEALSAFSPVLSERLAESRRIMGAIRKHEPQLLHIEGGAPDERFAAALWYAAFLNCMQADESSPCMSCGECVQIGAGLHPDICILDGRQGSIKIDDVRSLKPVMGEKPHFLHKRVIVLAEAQAMGIEAANSLLKILEEPSSDTCFLFTVPQRERLLPTLVSRGWVLTLPWPDVENVTASDGVLSDLIRDFLSTGKGWFDQASLRSSLDSHSAQRFVLVGQKALSAAMRREPADGLSEFFAGLPAMDRFSACDLLAETQDSLQAQVSVLLVIDRLMTSLFELVHKGAVRS